jgi:DNA polymerase
VSKAPPDFDPSPDLVGVLDYLRGIGYQEIYAPAEPPSAEAVRKSGDKAVPAPAPRSQAADGSATEPSAVAAEAPDAAERATALEVLGQGVAGCESCRLHETRNKVVFGVGNPDADLMFIGEGPGAEEDRQGIPFVGRAGELLTKIIAAIEMDRSDVYIANIVKCRPPRNRDPQPDEVAACRGYLESQIELIRPKLIVALGRVAAQTLLGESTPLGRMRGHWYLVHGVETRVTYHPAALLRNQGFKRPTWEDMQAVRDRLRELTAG